MEIAVSHCGDAYHETGIVNGKGMLTVPPKVPRPKTEPPE